MIDPLDYPYSIYKSSDGDALLDAHNDIIAVFAPHTEPEIEFMLANAPELLDKFMDALKIITTKTSQQEINEFLRSAGDILYRIEEGGYE